MKKIFLIILTTCLTLIGTAQKAIKFNKTINIDNDAVIPFERADLNSPPTNPAF